MKRPELITIHGVKEDISVLYNGENCNVITIMIQSKRAKRARNLSPILTG